MAEYGPYVCLGASSVSVIDTASNTVVATPALGPDYAAVPFGVAITPDGTRAYVTDHGLGSVTVIDTASNTLVATVRVGFGPEGLAMTPEVGPPTNKNQCKKGRLENVHHTAEIQQPR